MVADTWLIKDKPFASGNNVVLISLCHLTNFFSHSRRESGNCRVCWSADAKIDFGVSKDTNAAAGQVKGEECCAYGVDGKGIDDKGGYDCVMIPGAVKADDNTV